MLRGVAAALRAEARAANERRLLVLAGDRDAGYDAVRKALDGAGFAPNRMVLVSRRDVLECDRLSPDQASELLGTTQLAVVLDCHDLTRPNAVGQSVGAVDGGGLLVLVTPPLDAWADRRDGFDERLAVAPYGHNEVAGHFRQRLVATLRAHRGIAVVDVDDCELVQDGLCNPSSGSNDAGGWPDAPAPPAAEESGPRSAEPAERARIDHREWREGREFPPAAYAACLTADQARAVETLEQLRTAGHAVVLESDRGRGKSSAAGIAAAALAVENRDVMVTAPGYRNAKEVFDRANELLAALDKPAAAVAGDTRDIQLDSGGQIRYAVPARAVEFPRDPDVVIVDEAAALPVSRLESLLGAPAVAFATTVHGYEGAGRGFSVRFRDRLAAADITVHEEVLSTPIRYAAGDPVETWAFRALLLDARPAVDRAVDGTTPTEATYRRPRPADLVADEPRLREAFGLLVLAHYRTEPDDLARLLDAPNLSTRLLVQDGHVVAVALLAEEGNLSADTRRRMYAGERIRGNMVPDLLTAQLRDESAADLGGIRVVRIATHPAIRRRGLGSRLLADIADEFGERDWLAAGFGATPELIRFWQANGFGVIHIATTRNETSGEYSVLMVRPMSEAGRALHDRHARRFADRAESVLSGPLRDADPDTVRVALATVNAPMEPQLTVEEWRLVAGAAAGTAHLSTNPGPFRRLALAHLIDPAESDILPGRAERLLVAGVLQGHPAEHVATELGVLSPRQCMQELGTTFATLVERYGSEVARAELDRLT